MRNRETLRMVLTERDLAALVLVSEFGFVFARQLWGKAWPDTKTISMTYDRLGLMVRTGFLATVSIPGIREKVYTATKEGVSVAKSNTMPNYQRSALQFVRPFIKSPSLISGLSLSPLAQKSGGVAEF